MCVCELNKSGQVLSCINMSRMEHILEQFKMVKTWGNRGRGGSSQGPPTNNPFPSPELALILCSLEAINETLRGC